MPPRLRPRLDPQVTLVDRLWLVAVLAVGFADVILVQLVLPLFD